MLNINTSKIRGRIVEKYLYLGEFAKAIGKENRFISTYLNHQRYLTQEDIVDWAKALEISAEDIPAYFFTEEVNEIERQKSEGV